MEKTEIKSKCIYEIMGQSIYFKEKYGTSNPQIIIEDEHQKILPRWWGYMNSNPVSMLYAMRSAFDKLPQDCPDSGEVFYGHIKSVSGSKLGELVHYSELRIIK